MFVKGDKVVYPRHGAAVIESVLEHEAMGERRIYLKLRIPHGNLTIMVPVESAERVGLRGVVDKDEAEKVFDLLRQEEGWTPILWSQRYKSNLAKLVTGDIYQLAEVIRDLSLRERRSSLSSAEQRMLAKSREILISELTYTFDSSAENAQAMLDRALEESR